MLNAVIVTLALMGAADTLPLANAMPLHAPGGWHVDVGPGLVKIGESEIALADPQRLVVPVPASVTVEGEGHVLPLFKEKGGGWRRGSRLKSLIAQECSATGLLRPETVSVRPEAGGAAYVRGKDYDFDALWATVGRLDGGAIGEGERVHIDYSYGPARLDSIFVNRAGQARLVVGKPGLGFDPPPPGRDDEYRIGTVWNPGNLEGLAAENLFAVEMGAPQSGLSGDIAERLLPKTLAKLRAGEAVTIVAWGDSVTNGGGVGGKKEAWYQHVFHNALRERFPAAKITLHTASWPGRGSRNYLESPAGSEHDFQRDVLDRKPDLVTAEWVNDAYLKGDALDAHYGLIRDKMHAGGAELILLTPHLVRPDWMGVSTLKFDDDPRPYVQGLRRFAASNDIALADGAQRWCALWRQGIPYTGLLANAINHPDERGQKLLADALLAVFPAK
jgi:hypothetical protein